MFVIERLFSKWHDKEEKWERDCEKWIEAGKEDGSSYNYRSRRDYENRRPKPSTQLKTNIRITVGIIAAIASLGILIMTVITEANKPEDPKKKQEAAQTEGKNCKDFNKNDHVRVQYGDYVGNNGTIVGGCDANEDYQVKLDPNQKANLSNDGNSDPVDVGGSVIGVDSNKNLVKIEVPKEQ